MYGYGDSTGCLDAVHYLILHVPVDLLTLRIHATILKMNCEQKHCFIMYNTKPTKPTSAASPATYLHVGQILKVTR